MNHCWFISSRGLWLKIAKKESGSTSLTYAEALDGALAWGWIDGQKARFNDVWWLQRFTPRTAKSPWSKINRAKAETLIAAGTMEDTCPMEGTRLTLRIQSLAGARMRRCRVSLSGTGSIGEATCSRLPRSGASFRGRFLPPAFTSLARFSAANSSPMSFPHPAKRPVPSGQRSA
jgi:hypothetical protein